MADCAGVRFASRRVVLQLRRSLMPTSCETKAHGFRERSKVSSVKKGIGGRSLMPSNGLLVQATRHRMLDGRLRCR